MKILNHVSSEDLEALRNSDRVALVLMGGGAKGAYELGVWKVLWRLGIRKFCAISGTSVGALNALLVASTDPDRGENTWDDVIAAGVLEKRGRPLFGVISLLVAHLLIFLSIVLAVILFVTAVIILIIYVPLKWRGQIVPENVVLSLGCVGLGLVFCWATARIDASFLNSLTSGGYALPLFNKRPAARVKFVNQICVSGALLCTVAIFFFGSPTRHWPGWILWLAPVFWAILVILRHQGLTLLHRIVRVWPLFERDALDKAIKNLAMEHKVFPHCNGPVVATLTRHSTYSDPFRVHPLEERYGYWAAFDRYELRSPNQWRPIEPVGEWVPEYVDLRKVPDVAWVLSASSAIPFAFRALLRERPDYLNRKQYDVLVDGGVTDNLPILPVIEQKPEYIIVVALNARDMLGDESTLKQRLQENWRQSFFSKAENDALADEMRKQWIDSLPPNYFTEREELAKALAKNLHSFFAKFSRMSPGPFPPIPSIGPDLGDAKIIFIRPSTATSLQLPILGLITGTMRFDSEYKKRLVELGAKDAAAYFDK